MEVLLAIVLVGSAWVVFAVNMGSVLDKNPLSELESSFVRAQTEGRMLAFEDRVPHRLTWDAKANRFVLLAQAVVATYPVDIALGEGIKLKATFYFQLPLYKGESFDEPSWYEVDSVVFYGDATSAPFKVLLEDGKRKRELIVEPFTGFISQRG